MLKRRSLVRSAAAAVVLLAFFSTGCLSFKTKTDIRLESTQETVLVQVKDASAPEGYVQQKIELLRYGIVNAQVSVIDWGQTVLSTLEIVGSICLSAAMAMALTQAKSLGGLVLR